MPRGGADAPPNPEANPRISVTIDATCLRSHIVGTQLATLETIAALTRTERVRVRVVVARDAGGEALAALRDLPRIAVAYLPNRRLPTTDVVHRPFQVNHVLDVAMLRRLGSRSVITQQDLIAYRRPAYFKSRIRWRHYCAATKAALSLADSVICPSDYVRTEIARLGLGDPQRCLTIPFGVDHLSPETDASPPKGASKLDDTDFILCIGADYKHKNRCFALAIAHELQTRFGWKGSLVFAGPHVPHGSSVAEEAEYERRHPFPPGAVLRLGDVTEKEKTWLYHRAQLVIYATRSEGFGLVPFEAARMGTPCLFPPVTSLAEILPRDLAFITTWDASRSAQAAWTLMCDASAQASQVARIMQVARAYTWDSAAEELVNVYERLVRPSSANASSRPNPPSLGILNAAALKIADRIALGGPSALVLERAARARFRSPDAVSKTVQR